MVVAPASSYTTTDLRRPEVVDAALRAPVAVRESKTGQTLVLLTQQTVDQGNEVMRYAELLARAVVELQRPDPSRAHLGDLGFVTELAPTLQTQILRGFAEAVAVAINANDPKPVEDFITYLAGVQPPASGPLIGQFSEQTNQALARRLAG